MKPSPVNVAVVGASGNVGREILSILLARAFPIKKLDALASARSHGKQLLYGTQETVRLQNVETYDFEDIDIVLSSAGATVAEAFTERAVRQGAVVIDNSSRFRMDEDVPLVVPEVNGAVAQDYRARGIIANPNCSTIQMVMALKPLHDLWGLQRISVATYQSTSGAGRAGMDELFEQTKAIYQNKPLERDAFPKQIAFNVIPQIDVFMADGSSKEEWKMCCETKKIFADASIDIVATCVRVASFVGHGEAIHATFAQTVDVEQARCVLQETKGIKLVDAPSSFKDNYITPIDCAGEDDVYVSRLRMAGDDKRTLALWVVADNLRKGAALNTVQIAEYLLEHDLL